MTIGMRACDIQNLEIEPAADMLGVSIMTKNQPEELYAS